METARHRRKLAAALAVCMALAAGASQARRIEAEVARLDFPLGRVDGLRLQLETAGADQPVALELRANALDAGELGYRFRDLRWRCALTRDDNGGYRCEGALRARGHSETALRARWTDAGVELALRAARAEVALDLPDADAAPVRISATQLPLAWLQPLLDAAWEPGRFTAGTLQGELRVITEAASEVTRIEGPLGVEGAGLDSRDGRIAVADLDAAGELRLKLESRSTSIESTLRLRGGEILAGPVYVALPSTPVDLVLHADSAGAGRWNASTLQWKDPGVLQLQASGSLDTAAAEPLRAFDLHAAMPDLARAHARYLDTPLSTAGLAGLKLAGAAALRLTLREAQLEQAGLELTRIDARDDGGRFALNGLDGTVQWTAARDALDSRVQWQAAELYRIALGTADLPLRSSMRRLELRQPATLSLLQGQLQLGRFAWQPAQGDRGAHLDLALELQRLDLAALSRALDWPPFSGSLSGRIPGVRYAGDVLDLEGGLQIDVFGGRVAVDALTLERPFGVAPTLAANVALSSLDLQPLTAAFGFGEITGRLDGRVAGLRLLDWSPVAFDADLHTAAAGKEPRRISQRAVNDLSRVGGGGLVAGLQTQVLKIFQTFGYARIGLRCRLVNEVCHMDGVAPSGGGYVIVEGSGLPRITVIGHQRQVDWPVLLDRLKAATEGQTPIVD